MDLTIVMDELKKLTRRTDSIEKTVNLTHKDRDILENISIRMGTLADEVKHLADRVVRLEKNTTADSKDVLAEVQEIKDLVEKGGE